MNHRVESDLLGTISLPENVFYGVQTWRASQNFNLSGTHLNHFPYLIQALAMVKQAAARANNQLGNLTKEKSDIIEKACQKVINGDFNQYFIVDMIQGGAGTSTNMNANEVIANVGLEIMGKSLGDYQYLHPNNDVNMSQSTNDAYPTAVRIAVLLSHDELVNSLRKLKNSFSLKAKEFDKIIKMGRTQLQDAVPMTLGQEFQSWESTLGEDIQRIIGLSELLKEVNLGGTAIGTGINASISYSKIAVKELSSISNLPLVIASDLVEASSDMGAFVLFSSMLKRLAVKLSKIANDLRLLSMGPRAGLSEINLPAQQPGSSIMPGKVNPVIPEAVNQVAYQVIGNDLTVTMAAEAGQLQLNAMEPLIVFNILESIRLLTKAMDMFREYCIDGITANIDVCMGHVKNSVGIITVLNPIIGYENSTRIAKHALMSGESVIDLIRAENLLTEIQINELLSPESMCGILKH